MRWSRVRTPPGSPFNSLRINREIDSFGGCHHNVSSLWYSAAMLMPKRRSIKIADPDYIVTFGVGLPRFFKRYIQRLRAKVLHLPFPSKRSTPPSTMRAAIEWATASLIALERGHGHRIWNGRGLARTRRSPNR